MSREQVILPTQNPPAYCGAWHLFSTLDRVALFFYQARTGCVVLRGVLKAGLSLVLDGGAYYSGLMMDSNGIYVKIVLLHGRGLNKKENSRVRYLDSASGDSVRLLSYGRDVCHAYRGYYIAS